MNSYDAWVLGIQEIISWEIEQKPAAWNRTGLLTYLKACMVTKTLKAPREVKQTNKQTVK